MVSQLIGELEKSFEKNRDPENAAQMKKYLRNKFELYGIMAKKKHELFNSISSKFPINKVSELKKISIKSNRRKEREFHHFAIFIWEKHPDLWTEKDGGFFGLMLNQNSWWDNIDYLISKVISPYFIRFPNEKKKLVEEWNNSKSIWQIRASILHQLKWKTNTEKPILKKMILKQRTHPEFFVQKAIGWALREYSKTDSEFVMSLISGNKLAPLSNREGLKWLNSRRNYKQKG
jgi:3-methyladenine DNA glycosylase AlkD